MIKFIFKNNSKNKEYYYCFKNAKGCPGKALYDITNNEFRIYISCDFQINHNKYTFEKF